MEQSYTRRGEGYNSDWAFHQMPREQPGRPDRQERAAAGRWQALRLPALRPRYAVQRGPNWGDVRRLNTLLGGKIPAAGLARALLDASYRAGGATLHPDRAFHQYAVANQLGPPIGESTTVTVDGAQYAYQVFALDTLYNAVPNWADVRRLSALANATASAQLRLRDALLAQTYRAGGATYHADWAFHQLARSWNLGAPLSDSYRVSSGAGQYAIQVYAADTLYNVVPNWADVRRLSALTAPRPAVLGAESPALPAAQPRATTTREPTTATFQIVQHSSAAAMPTAYSERDGARIALIVLRGDTGPATQTLAAMTTPGARAAAHYYAARTGPSIRSSMISTPPGMPAWPSGTAGDRTSTGSAWVW